MDEVSNDNCCFICGKNNPTGLQTRPWLDKLARRASMQLAIPQRFQGWKGIAHGGILAALLDEVAVYACMSESTQFVTAGMNVRYLKPVPVEQSVEVSAEVVEVKRRKLTVFASLLFNGEVCAEADVTIIELKDKS